MEWKKSSFSTQSGNCVETASNGGNVYVRDTKARDTGTLQFPGPAWRRFTGAVKRARP